LWGSPNDSGSKDGGGPGGGEGGTRPRLLAGEDELAATSEATGVSVPNPGKRREKGS